VILCGLQAFHSLKRNDRTRVDYEYPAIRYTAIEFREQRRANLLLVLSSVFVASGREPLLPLGIYSNGDIQDLLKLTFAGRDQERSIDSTVEILLALSCWSCDVIDGTDISGIGDLFDQNHLWTHLLPIAIHQHVFQEQRQPQE